MNEKCEKEIDILRARAIAAALGKAKPPDYLTNESARHAWYDCVQHVAAVVCTAGGVSLITFYDLCEVPR